MQCTKVYRETGNTNDTIMIFADELKVRNGSKAFVPFKNSCRAFWKSCAEDDVKTAALNCAGPYRPCVETI